MSATPSSPQNWLITGVSGGIGRATAEAALARGDTVWGTVRQAAQVAAFDALAPGRAHALVMDVTQPAQVQAGVARVLAAGRLDVLVNNAGVGLVGTLEETSMDEARTVFETNFFGVLAVTRAVLPALRAQGAGRIINISSGVGLTALPGMALYSASKFALEGLTEALAAEVAGFGLQVCLVEPGAVQSNFVGPAMHEAAGHLPAYAAFSGHGRAGLAHYYAEHASSSESVAAAVLALADHPTPPLRTLVGDDIRRAYAARVPGLQALAG